MADESLEGRLEKESLGKRIKRGTNRVLYNTSKFTAESSILGLSYLAGAGIASKFGAESLDKIVGNNFVNVGSAELLALAGIGALTAAPFLGRKIRGFYENMKRNIKNREAKEYNWPLVIGGLAGAVSAPIALSYLNANSVSNENLRAIVQYAQQSISRDALAYSAAAVGAGYGAKKLMGHAFRNFRPFKSLKAKAGTVAAAGVLIAGIISNPVIEAFKSSSFYQNMIHNPQHVAVFYSSQSAKDTIEELEKLRALGIDVSLLRDFSNEGIFRVVSEPGSRRSVDNYLAELKEQGLVKEQSWIKVAGSNDLMLAPEELYSFLEATKMPDFDAYKNAILPIMMETTGINGAPLSEKEATRRATSMYFAAEAFEVPLKYFVSIPWKETHYVSSAVGDVNHTDRYGNPNDARTSFQFLRRTMEEWHQKFLNDREAVNKANDLGINIWERLPSYENWHKYPEIVSMIAAYKFSKDIEYFMPIVNSDTELAIRLAIHTWNAGRGNANPDAKYVNDVIEKSGFMDPQVFGE